MTAGNQYNEQEPTSSMRTAHKRTSVAIWIAAAAIVVRRSTRAATRQVSDSHAAFAVLDAGSPIDGPPKAVLQEKPEIIGPDAASWSFDLSAFPRRSVLVTILALLAAGCSQPSVSQTVDSQAPSPTAESQTTTTLPRVDESTTSEVTDWPASYTGPRNGPFFPGGPEHIEFTIACLIDSGFSVSPRADGRGYSGPNGPDPRFQEALTRCEQLSFELGLVARIPVDDAFLQAKYRAFMWTHECLTVIGAPTTPPPSLDSFLDSKGTNWSPYDGLPSGGEVALAEEGMAPPSASVVIQLEQQAQCPMHLPVVFAELGITALDLAGSE